MNDKPEPNPRPRRAHLPRTQDEPTERVSVILTREQVETLTAIAAAEFRSLPGQLAYIIHQHLQQREKKG